MSAAPDTLRADAPPITIALAIPHTPWVPERVESVARLRDQLGFTDFDGKGPTAAQAEAVGLVAYAEFTERTTNDRWSQDLWRFGAESGASHLLELQDDVEVGPTFWGALRAIIATAPEDVIGLEVAHPAARALAEEDVRLFTTADMLIGVGYVIPTKLLAEFLAWRETQLREGWRIADRGKTALTEDTMIAVWCLVTGRKIVHPIPTIIDHDTSLASTYGNDEHTNRRPLVTWRDGKDFGGAWDDTDLEAPGFWQGMFRRMRAVYPDGTVGPEQRGYNTRPQDVRVPHLGRFYDATPALARAWVKDFDEAAYMRARRDSGDAEKRRLVYARRAKPSSSSRKRVLVCTPTRGGADPRYTTSMLGLAQLFDYDLEHGLELLDSWLWHDDVVRVRSRFARAARETDAHYLHFRDADVPASARALLGMLRAERPFVATPYPRRDSLDWARVKQGVTSGEDLPLEAFAYDYAIELLPGTTELRLDKGACLEVASVPLGCSLISIELLERMTQHYAELDDRRVDLEKHFAKAETIERLSRKPLEQLTRELAAELVQWRLGHMGLRFLDLVDGKVHPTIALFPLFVRNGILGSEDNGFCKLARDMGEKIWLYLGPGAPADHVGEHLYRGRIEAFGMSHVSPQEARRREAAPPPAGGDGVDPVEIDPATGRDPAAPEDVPAG